MTAEDYDRTYAKTTAVFGAEPEEMLCRFASRLSLGRAVLDVGCGQGRNAVWLAEQGFEVVAVDPSEVAVRTLRELASARRLPIEVFCGGFHDIQKREQAFGGICVFGLIQILSREGIDELRECVERWSDTGSLLFISAWTEQDPRFAEIARTWERTGPGSFRHSDGRIRTYLAEGEILGLFPDWAPLHHWCGLGPWHHHGDGVEERHGRVELVAVRR